MFSFSFWSWIWLVEFKGGPSPKADFDDAQNVFVFHLPNLWKDEDLHAQFSNYGKVISAKVMVEPDKKRSRGFGFVAYGTAREAHEAIAKANGLPIQGKRLKVELKTPQDQTKGGRKSISNDIWNLLSRIYFTS